MARSDAEADLSREATNLALPLLDRGVHMALLRVEFAGAEDEAITVGQGDSELIIDVRSRACLLRCRGCSRLGSRVDKTDLVDLLGCQIDIALDHTWLVKVTIVHNAVSGECHVPLVEEEKALLS